MRADLVEAATLREPGASEFDVFSPREARKVQEQIVQTRWVLTRKMVGGKKCVRARLVAESFQDPELKEGLVDTSGCVSLRSSHLREVSLSAIQRRKLRGRDIKNAFLQAGGLDRDVFLHAPMEWDSTCTMRVWKLKAPAYGLNDAPVAFYRIQNYR